MSSTPSLTAVTINTAISGKIVVQGDKEDICGMHWNKTIKTLYRILQNSSTVLLLCQNPQTLYYYFCVYYYYFNLSMSKNFASQSKKVASFGEIFTNLPIGRYIFKLSMPK